jgi:hypothetical protein
MAALLVLAAGTEPVQAMAAGAALTAERDPANRGREGY